MKMKGQEVVTPQITHACFLYDRASVFMNVGTNIRLTRASLKLLLISPSILWSCRTQATQPLFIRALLQWIQFRSWHLDTEAFIVELVLVFFAASNAYLFWFFLDERPGVAHNLRTIN